MCVGVCVFDPIYFDVSAGVEMKKRKHYYAVFSFLKSTNDGRAVPHNDEELPPSIPATIPTDV